VVNMFSPREHRGVQGAIQGSQKAHELVACRQKGCFFFAFKKNMIFVYNRIGKYFASSPSFSKVRDRIFLKNKQFSTKKPWPAVYPR